MTDYNLFNAGSVAALFIATSPFNIAQAQQATELTDQEIACELTVESIADIRRQQYLDAIPMFESTRATAIAEGWWTEELETEFQDSIPKLEAAAADNATLTALATERYDLLQDVYECDELESQRTSAVLAEYVFAQQAGAELY